jgi:hypothetical protein
MLHTHTLTIERFGVEVVELRQLVAHAIEIARKFAPGAKEKWSKDPDVSERQGRFEWHMIARHALNHQCADARMHAASNRTQRLTTGM